MTDRHSRPHTGRIALVTGSTGGIGFAVAERLAALGADIALHGFGDADQIGRQVAAVADRFGVRVHHFDADFTDAGCFPGLVERINGRLGPVDILVNNAGMQHVCSIVDFPPDKWDAMLAINLSAAFHTIRLCVPAMLARGWGRIVNIASVSGLVGTANKPAYVATKHGLVGLTKSVAMEFATTPVTCNAICPGWVLTPMVQKQVDALGAREGLDGAAAAARLVGAKQPSQTFVTVRQVASLVGYLCSDDAAEVRGAHWNMDGGYVAA